MPEVNDVEGGMKMILFLRAIISNDILALMLDMTVVEDGIQIQDKTWHHKDDGESRCDRMELAHEGQIYVTMIWSLRLLLVPSLNLDCIMAVVDTLETLILTSTMVLLKSIAMQFLTHLLRLFQLLNNNKLKYYFN